MSRYAWALALLASGSASLAAGCGWGNPWDTRRDEAAYEAKKTEDLRRNAIEYYAPPQHETRPTRDADLEGWRDTVLATADEETLRHIRTWSMYKIGQLEARAADLRRADPHANKGALARADDDLRVEKLRLEMVEARLKDGRPRRAE